MAAHQRLECPACGSIDPIVLPVPHPANAMLSDGQRLPYPLHKVSCQSCGHGFHARPPSADGLRSLFDEKYSLGHHDPAAEGHRATLYGQAINAFLKDNGIGPPKSMLEIGCGMGSLLTELSQRWTCDKAAGIEPSSRLSDVAKRNCPPGISIHQGFAEDLSSLEDGVFDLCLSVNVMEHTLSPSEFLANCRRAIGKTGTILVICPDGEQPSSELLFYDHISSFTGASLSAFAQRAGLRSIASRILTGPLKGFRMHLLQHGESAATDQPCGRTLADRRSLYLGRWKNTMQNLKVTLGADPYAIFGTGEFADLLMAYCPDIVANASCFVTDAPRTTSHVGKNLLDTETFLRTEGMKLVAAVHERSWPGVSVRFKTEGRQIFHPCIHYTDKETL